MSDGGAFYRQSYTTQAQLENMARQSGRKLSFQLNGTHADSGTGQVITDLLRNSFALSIEKLKIYFTLRNLEAAKISGIKEVCLLCCEL